MAAIVDAGLPGSESAELDVILPEVELEDSEDEGARGSDSWREAQARRAVTTVLAASSGPFRHELARLLRCLPRRPPPTNGVGLSGGPSASGGSGIDALYDSDVCGDASSLNGGNGGGTGTGWPRASDDDRSSGIGGCGSSGGVLSDDGVPEMAGVDYGGENVGFCGRYRGLIRSPPRSRPAPQPPPSGSVPSSPSVPPHGASGTPLPLSPPGFPHSVSTGALRTATALSGALSPDPQQRPQQQLPGGTAAQSAPNLDSRSRAQQQRQTAANAAGTAAATSAGFVFTPLSATAPNGGFGGGGGVIALAGAEAAAALAAEEAAWREMPLADITAVYGSDSVPEGFVRVSKSVGGKRADLNSGAGGQYLYLCVRKGASAGRAPIVGLAVIFPDRDEYVPPSYAVIRRKGQPVNLNHHTTGERVYLCYKRGAGNPLCDVAVVLAARGEGPPKGYHLLESSPSGLPADLNAGTGGSLVLVAYRQHLVALLGLRDPAFSELPLDAGAAEQAAAAAAAGLDSSGLNPPTRSRGPGDRAMSESALEATKAAAAAGSSGQRGAAAAAAAAAPSGLEAVGHRSSPALDVLAAETNGNGGADGAARLRTSTMGSYDALLQPHSGEGIGASVPGGNIDIDGGLSPQPGDGESPPREFLGLARGGGGGRSGCGDLLGGDAAGGNGGDGGVESGEAAAWWSAREAAAGAGGAAAAGEAAAEGRVYSIPGGDGPASPRLRDLLFLLLTAVHVRHEEVAEVAIGELTSLLIAADFFAADFRAVGAFEPPIAGGGSGVPGGEGPSRTLLDFAVDAVCNQADQVVQARFPAVLQFLRAVVQRSSGRLGPAALQRIFQTYSLMCSFSASSLPWLRARGQLPFGPDDAAYTSFKELLVVIFRRVETAGGAGTDIGPLGWGVWDGPLITFDEPPILAALDTAAAQVPAGDQAAAALASVAALAAVEGGAGRETGAAAAAALIGLPQEAVPPFMELLVHQMVDSAVDMVELATLMDGVLESLRRHSSATADSLWGDMRTVGTRLFPPGSASGSDCSGAIVAVFVVVAALCKMATAPLRVLPSGELVARDLGNKILALDLLHEMLKACGERLRHNRIFGYVIRRLVVSAVLTNCHDGSALMDERAFQLLLGVVRMLWRHFRRHCKVELVVLLEDFLLKVLRASSRRVPPAWRMQVLDELLRWFDIPHNLVELFLNYDMDRKFIRQWKIFQEMCSLVCSMAEGWYMVDSAPPTGNGGAAAAAAAAAAHEQDRAALRLQALRSAAQIVKSLMDASGHGHLIAQDPRTREISLGAAGGWEEDDTGSSSGGDDDVTKAEVAKARRLLAASGGTLPQLPEEGVDPTLDAAFAEALAATSAPSTPAAADAETSRGDRSSGGGGGGGGGGRDRSGSERSGGASSNRGEAMRGKNGRKRHRRPNSFRYRKELRKRAEEVMKQALDLYRAKGLKKAVQYLVGSSFIADTPHDIANFLRVYRDELDPAAIGEFLSEPDFDSGEYWKLIRLQYVRAISFHGMTLEEALRHLLTNSGFRLPGEAQKIDRLLSAFAECYFADNKGQPTCPFGSAETPYVLSYAIIMLNTDLHRANTGNSKKKRKRMTKDAFISNLRGVAGVSNGPEKGNGNGASTSSAGGSSANSGGVQQAYLSDIYDSIEARPIALLLQDGVGDGGDGGGGGAGANAAAAQEDPFRELAKAANQGQELLRGLSMFSHRFYVVGQDTSLSLDLVRLMFEAVWFHFHGVINSVLDRAHADVDTVLSCLDVVRYAISATTFLNMRTERAAFLTQLAKFRHRMAAGGSGSVGTNAVTGGVAAKSPLATAAADGHRAEPWFVAIETARPADAGAAVAQVHALVQQLEQSVHETYSKEELYAVARRIRNVDLLDADRRFLREGDLVKSCRSGKKVTYRFFLFSDQVLYAHCSFGGEWRVHEQLLLSLLKIANVKDKKDCRFQMQHPKKSFVVMAESAELKRLWMRDIANATQALLKERIDSRASLASSIRLDPAIIRAAAEAAGIPTAGGAAKGNGGSKQANSHEALRSPASTLSLGDTAAPELGRSGRGGGSSAGGSPRNNTMSSTMSRALSRSPNFGFGAVKKRISMKKLMPGGGSKAGGSQPASRRGSAASASSAAAAVASASLEAVLESSTSEATSDHGLFDNPSATNTPIAAGSGSSSGGVGGGGGGGSPLRSRARSPSPQPAGAAEAGEDVEADLAQRFRKALHRYAEEAEKPQSPFSDTEKLVIYGLYKQARSGDCPDAVLDGVDPKESMKMQAWRANYGMSNAAAVESFIEILARVVPDWEDGGAEAAKEKKAE